MNSCSSNPICGPPGRGFFVFLLVAIVALTPLLAQWVEYDDQTASYRELDERASELAEYLGTLGVTPGSCVAICVERSLDLIVGLVAIVKAGALYVPMDPDFPKHRLAVMLEDAKVRVLLTQEHLVSQMPDHGGRTVCLDGAWPEIYLGSGVGNSRLIRLAPVSTNQVRLRVLEASAPPSLWHVSIHEAE